MNLSYDYQKPHLTYTLDQFISCQSDSVACYHNLSFVDINNGIAFDTYNVVSDYIDEMRDEFCVTVQLNDDQMSKYKYRPKLLCHDIYGNGELAFLIMIINDMCNVKDFVKDKLLMPDKSNMNALIKYLINANSSAIRAYNKK